MENCKYALTIPAVSDITLFAREQHLCGAYSESKRKDGRHWGHYPECRDVNCPLQHPELLEDAILESERSNANE